MPRFVSEKLTRKHRLDAFDCGDDVLNQWFVRYALHAHAMRTARTFVWHNGDMEVVAYFSLAAHLLVRADMPKRIGRGSPKHIPAVMLARLALDECLQGQGLGGELLWDALTRACAAAEIAAARVVVVDAIDAAAASFYSHHGFVALPATPMRLVQKMSDVVAAIG